MFWSDAYVGLPFAKRGRSRHGLDCYGLVRLVLRDMAGLDLPRFDVWDTREKVLARETCGMTRVARGGERALDVVIMTADQWRGGRWCKAPLHMGVVVARGQVLHIEEGRLSCVDNMALLDIVEIVRGPEMRRVAA